MKKTAVILLNLGGPDSLSAVKPFLYNLFNDPAIIRLPPPLRQFVAWMISSRREETAKAIYEKMGGRSPILPNTEAQAKALQNALSDLGDVRCFIVMRYWHPMSDEVIKDVEKYAPDQIVYLPLYPQYSTTTTASSLKDFKEKLDAHDWGRKIPTKTICCYPAETGFIRALSASIKKAYTDAQKFGRPRVLFSAHGLPEKIVLSGDPYQIQCEMTAQALVKDLAIDGLDWVLCFQSRVGPLKWIGPATDEEVRRAGKDKVPVVIAPIAFVSEHSETLVELDIEYRHLSQEVGVPHYGCVPTVSVAPLFVAALAKLVRQALSDPRSCISNEGGRICPKITTECCQEIGLKG